ncbi:MAG: hypothetical protein GF329_21325 [Candidatus Lokiarchaeota archaeon]|nr:hypothetical protein [Candidatus Lokiarchaeota archaeon]
MSGPLKKGKLPKELTSQMEATASASQYLRKAVESMKDFLPLEKQRRLYINLQKMFDTDPISFKDEKMYKRNGLNQSEVIMENIKIGKNIALEREIPMYDPSFAEPIGHRQIIKYKITNSDKIVSADKIHALNNIAMQKLYDDVRRTTILNLDVPHKVIQVRAGKEVTPETINHFLKTLQHTIAGGIVSQDQFADVNPKLMKDAYCKIITGNDELSELIDNRLSIDINENFHESRAEKLKQAIGDTIHLVVRAPKLLVRSLDNSIAYKWAGIQSTLSFIASYRLTKDSNLSDIAYATQKANTIAIGEPTWQSFGGSHNSLGGIPFGYFADMCQGDSELPLRPFMEVAREDSELSRKYLMKSLDALTIIVPILTNFWDGYKLAGGSNILDGLTVTAFIGGIFDDFIDIMNDMMNKYFSKITKLGMKVMPKRWYNLRWPVENMVHILMETMEKYPTAMETLRTGGQKMYIISLIAGIMASLLSGSSTAGLWAVDYSIGLLVKEGWCRTGKSGNEAINQLGLPYSCSLRMEEGGLPELRGMNSFYQSLSLGSAVPRVAALYAASLARGDAWVCSPLIKAAFADTHLSFDFKNPRKEIIKGIED